MRIDVSGEDLELATDFARRLMELKRPPDRIGTRIIGAISQDQMRGKLGEILASRRYGGKPDFLVFEGHDESDLVIMEKRISVKSIPEVGELYMNLPRDKEYARQDFHCCVKLDDPPSFGYVSKLLPDDQFMARAVRYPAGTLIGEIRRFWPTRKLGLDPAHVRRRSTHLLEDNFVIPFDEMERIGLSSVPEDLGSWLGEVGW